MGRLSALFDDVKIKTTFYSIFYNLTLSPNQVLDSAWLQNLYSETDPIDWPFVFTVHENVYENENPFIDQIVIWLRRSGEKAFIFSSLNSGSELAKKWGDFVLQEGKKLSDEDLVIEAAGFYGQAIEWARELDAKKGKISISSYGQGPLYSEIYRDLLSPHGFGYLEVPENRSQTYTKITGTYDDAQFDKARVFPDIVSNIQYAKSSKARLIIPDNSPFTIIENEEEPENEDGIANVVLDLNGILDAYPEIADAILNASVQEISRIRKATHANVLGGWNFLNSKDRDNAKKKFTNALSELVGNYIHIDKPTFPITIALPREFSPVPIGPKIDLSLPPIPMKAFKKLMTKWKLRGLDKFINFRNNP